MNRRGIALFVAMAALLMLEVIAATGVSLALREAALGRAALAEAKARAAADGALAEGYRGWDPGIVPTALGDSTTLPVKSLPGAVLASLELHFLGGPILALRGTGTVLGGSGAMLARSRVELLIRLDSAVNDTVVYPRAITRGWRRIP